jgi:glycosyltransferase involved in cell wall biosynthesis
MIMSPCSDMTSRTLPEANDAVSQVLAPGIAVVINTLNEESNIGDCIDSVREFADEIVVCDMHSEDQTLEIARQKGARIVLHPRTGFVEPARRFAISHARYEWVLVLDADERMTDLLATKLKEMVDEDRYDVVSFWSLYWYFGGWVRHGRFFNGNWRRFFRKNVYLETYTASEERVHHNFESLTRAKSILHLPKEYFIEHYAYKTLEKYLVKTLGGYARIEGEEYVQFGRKFSLLRMLWEPLKEFLSRFVLRQGYMDGLRGFILACLYSGYRFSVWANVWFLQNKKDV